MGAAYLAGLAEGVWSSTDQIRDLWQLEAEFEPSGSRDLIDTAYDGWNRAVQRASDWITH
jgi:glycerol kinase